MKIITIEKSGVTVHQCMNESGVVGYIKYLPQYATYMFLPNFETKYSSNDLLIISQKINDINETIKK